MVYARDSVAIEKNRKHDLKIKWKIPVQVQGERYHQPWLSSSLSRHR
jgi:hypothetical protein